MIHMFSLHKPQPSQNVLNGIKKNTAVAKQTLQGIKLKKGVLKKLGFTLRGHEQNTKLNFSPIPSLLPINNEQSLTLRTARPWRFKHVALRAQALVRSTSIYALMVTHSNV